MNQVSENSFLTNASHEDVVKQHLIPSNKRSVYTWESIVRTNTIQAPKDDDNGHALKKCLNALDLIAYGVGSTVGAGIFVTVGVVASRIAGPGILVSFLSAAFACFISAFCYAEFSVNLPVSGSAYTFSYVSLGELCGWFIGWNLTLEYSISASAVARGWAGYVAKLFAIFGLDLPDYVSGYPVNSLINISPLAVVIIALCTLILAFGVKDSARFNLVMTVINVSTILFIIITGALYVDTRNWEPFFPFGLKGAFAGAGTVFFSYIGFDSVTTLAGEVERPGRDLPLGIVGTLLIATVLYVAVSLVITGMVPYFRIDKNAPLAVAFSDVGLKWAATLIAIGSVTALTATTLCTLLGQPRIYYQMAKDGLFFRPFGRVSPKTQVPLFGTIVTGIVSSTLALLFDLDILTEMISIGTLLAFIVVCAGIVVVRFKQTASYAPKTQGVDAMRKWVIHFIIAFFCFSVVFSSFVKYDFPIWVIVISTVPLLCIMALLSLVRQTNVPLTFKCPLVPVVPLVGVLVNTFLIVQLPVDAMLRVLIWSFIGFAIYFGYGIRHSRLNSVLSPGELM